MDITKRNNVRVFGEGSKPMLFGHGFGCDQNMWRYVAPELAKDYKIILYDYVGCGKSDISAYNHEKYANLNGYAQDILDICNELDLQNIIFVGHSVSCMIGLLAALKQPERFERLIFIGPSARYINDGAEYFGGFEKEDIEQLLETMDKNYIGWANFLAPVVMQNKDRPELAAELEESFCSTDPVIARRFAGVTFLSDNRKDLSKVKTPSLILQCSEDLIAPLEVGMFLSEQMQHSTLRIMKATGHCPQMSAPQETITLIKEYLLSSN